MPEYEVDSHGCWVWSGQRTEQNYPVKYAHRRYWEAVNGPRPDGWHIHHVCRNTLCVNPAHLEAIDPRDHFAEHHLHENGLTFDDVEEIKRLGRTPGVKAVEVATRFGVHRFTVYRYWNAERWTPELGNALAVPPAWKCAAPDCDNDVTGRRHKQFCSKTCQGRIKARRARQRQRAAREPK